MNEQDYPPLPPPDHESECDGYLWPEAYSADQMRAYVEADRALRVPDIDEVLRAVCETDPADLNDRRNICISPKDLEQVLRDCMASPDPAVLAQRVPAYLLGGMRFKVCVPNYRDGAEIIGIPEELNGRWVAFVAAENDCHMLSAAPAPTAQRVSTIPEGWRVDVKDDLFKTISIVAPNGYAAITTSVSRNPENVLRMLVQDLLAAAPQPPAQPERKPMTYEQLAEIGDRVQPHEWSSAFARAIEAFHGIKETP